MRRREADIAELYRRHGRTLLLFLVRRTADPEAALDLWAETFAQATAARRAFRGTTDDEAAAWLYGIAKRQLAQFYRRGSAERRALERLRIERPPLTPEVEAELVREAGLAEVRREVAAAVAVLSPDVREAVALRVVNELPYADVAARLVITEAAARARVSRGLRALGGALDLDTITEAVRA